MHLTAPYRLRAIALLAILFVLTLPLKVTAATHRQGPLNILLIVADDLGGVDLGCYGADLHETPALDRLAREGMRFTQAYAPAPVCSPTRAALLTGKAPARLHMTQWSEGSMNPPRDRKLLPAESLPSLPHTETTLAKVLQSSGYLTGLVGKWHLGDADFYPETHGFDVNIGGTRWGAPQTYFYPYRGSGRFEGEQRYVPHLEFGKPGEYLTDRLTDEALHVLDRARDAKKPFFLMLAHHAPHTPIQAKPADLRYFEGKLRPGMKHRNPAYAAMIRSLDDNVKRVLDHLKKQRLDQDTVVIFTSDNGGYIGTSTRDGQTVPVTDNHPLRSGKGTLYEGGLRVPLIVKWPGVTTAGSESREPVILTDLFRTLIAATQTPLPAMLPGDGSDLTPLLRNPRATLSRDALYFHYPHYYHAPPSTPVSAVRAGDWKLLEFFEDQHGELYDLKADPGEQQNMATRMPEKVAELRRRLQEWRQSVNAALPRPNPNL